MLVKRNHMNLFSNKFFRTIENIYALKSQIVFKNGCNDSDESCSISCGDVRQQLDRVPAADSGVRFETHL